MKKWELKMEIETLRERLFAYQRSEPILLAQLEQMRLERDDAIQKCQAAEMALGEQTGSGPQVDREVRIGGEEEAQEKEARLGLSKLGQRVFERIINGDQENTERPDNASGSGIHTRGNDGRFYYDTGWFDAGYWIDTDVVRKELDHAKRQAGLLNGDGERERTD